MGSLRPVSLKRKCEGCDSNARIPTKMDPKPIAFDLAGQPSQGVLFHIGTLRLTFRVKNKLIRFFLKDWSQQKEKRD